MGKKARHMPKSLIMKGLGARGLKAERKTVSGIRTWVVTNLRTGATSHIPTLEMVYDVYLAEKKVNVKSKTKKTPAVEVLEGDPSA